MYTALNQASADVHRHDLHDEAARTRLLLLATCCARAWDRARTWWRDVVRTTRHGRGHQPAAHLCCP